MPAVRLEQPGPAKQIAFTKGLQDCLAPGRNVNVERNEPGTDDPEPVGDTVLIEDAGAAGEGDIVGERDQPLAVAGRQSPEKPVANNGHCGPSVGSCRAASRSRFSAWASSVMSIPTGHHTMQRPQPTHPELSNWSYQVPSLWVAHCR